MPAKRCSGRRDFSTSGRGPVASLSLSRGRRGDGILFFQITFGRLRREIGGSITIAVCAIAVVMASCSNRPINTSTSETTREVTDEAGRRVRLPLHIDRIVSLAPNLTEIVYAVGAGGHLVGDTEYCDYPAEAKKVAKIGD